MRRLQGQWALVTGASSGIGKDVAEILAELGCRLVLTARRVERLEALSSAVSEKYGTESVVIPLDLAVPGAPEKLFEETTARGIDVDILVNNAGYGIHGFFLDVPWERTADMLQLLINNLTHLTHLYTRPMVTRDYGFVLQVSSIGAFQPVPGFAAYAAAKAYVLDFGVALNHELRHSSVRCTVLCPGITITEFQEVAGHEALTTFERLLAMNSHEVARAAIAAMLKGKPVVVPGRINALNAWAVRLLPRSVAAAVAYLTLGPPRDLGG